MRETAADFLLDLFVGVLLDKRGEKGNSLFDVGSVQFLQLLNENVEHTDGYLSLLCLVGVDALLYLLFGYIGLINIKVVGLKVGLNDYLN